MAYTKAGMKAVDKYVRENYDRIGIKIPKGRKTAVEAYAKSIDESINSIINKFLRESLGMTEEEWKSPFDTTDTGDA